MPYVPFQFPLTGGFDRSVVPGKADRATFYDMTNWRQSRTYRGLLETTPRFKVHATRSQGTIWQGGMSATETTTSAVKWFGTVSNVGSITLTQYCAFNSSTQIKALWRTTEPSSDGVTKGCLLVIQNAGAMTVSLGSTYDVEIDGATTFKWRVNGGAYTTGVTINLTSGNAIDAGAVRLYWLADSGFTVTDAWSWTRTDGLSDDNATALSIPNVYITDTCLWFRAYDGSVGVIESIGNATPCIRSAGYRNITCTDFGYFEDHLFLFGPGAVVVNSDVTDLDNFTATDVNEADSKTLPLDSQVPTQTALNVYGGGVLAGRLYVVTDSGIFYTDYHGLPTVFSYKKLIPHNFDNNNDHNTVVSSPRGLYILTPDSLFLFNGQLSKVVDFNVPTVATVDRMVYNAFFNELIISWEVTGFLLVYQEKYNTFYIRFTDFSTSGVTGVSYNALTGSLYLGTVSRVILVEDTDMSGTPVFDSNDGTAYATPKIITQLVGGVSGVKETAPVYVAPRVVTGGSGYYTDSTVKLVLGWFTSDNGELTGLSVSTDANAYWSSASVGGMISYPRVSYRYIAFQLTTEGTNATKPASTVNLSAVETEFLDNDVKR